MQTGFPIEEVRSKFPALGRTDGQKPIIYFDGPGGTQMVDDAMNEMVRYIQSGMANLHGTFPTSMDTEETVAESRRAAADFLGCKENEIAFGPNMTTLAFSVARGLGHFIEKGDEIIVTELDHRANVDPWLTMAKDCGATVKFIPLDKESCTLRLDQLDGLVTPKTKIVAVGMSSNVTGTVTDIAAVTAKAKRAGALVIVDAVHAAPHLPIDFERMQADILFCSGYKFFGPHIGIAAVREDLFEKLPVYKLQPAPGDIPYKLETGTQNHEAIAGLLGAISFIEQLGEGATRRERLISGMERIDRYESLLAAELEEFLLGLEGIRLFRAPAGTTRTPTFAFTLKGHDSRAVTQWFAENHNMCIADGDFYASTMAAKYGVHDQGGWIRIGLAPYNTVDEIQQFKSVMETYLELQPAEIKL